jgi:hypothetical protein
MAFWTSTAEAIRGAVRATLTPTRPPNIAGDLFHQEDRYASYNPRTGAPAAQERRVAAYDTWRDNGTRRNTWTNWVGYNRMANGRWIPVHSSNVSAIRWAPLNPYGGPTTGQDADQDALANRTIPANEYRSHVNLNELTKRGHGGQIVINGTTYDTRDTDRLKTLMTPAEFRAYTERMLNPNQPPVVLTRGEIVRQPYSTSLRLKEGHGYETITEATNGILFVRYHDKRIYMYPGISLGDALDMYHSPSKGRWVWDELRWSGRPYQQIAGPPVKYRVGEGR